MAVLIERVRMIGDHFNGLLCLIVGFAIWFCFMVLKMPDFAYIVPGAIMYFGPLFFWGRLLVMTLGRWWRGEK